MPRHFERLTQMRLTKVEERRVYEAWKAAAGDLPAANDPENEYKDNVIVAQEGHVRLLYSAAGSRFEVDSDNGDRREFLVVVTEDATSWSVRGLHGPYLTPIGILGFGMTRQDAEREQFWSAHELYRKTLGYHHLPDNCLLAQYQ